MRLPVHEETGLEFASEVDGMMHACGHDGHTTMVLGAAAILKEESLPVSIRFIFQPAEETGFGAKKMIEEGELDGVSMIFGGTSIVTTMPAASRSPLVPSMHLPINSKSPFAVVAVTQPDPTKPSIRSSWAL